MNPIPRRHSLSPDTSSTVTGLERGYGPIAAAFAARIPGAETAGLVAAAAILYELGDME
jgi:hypothetical protein